MRLDRKAFGRVATTFVATAMLAAVAAVPASAAGIATDSNTMEITTTLTVPDKLTVPTATITYTVDDVAVDEYDLDGVEQGVDGAVSLAQVTFTPADSEPGNGEYTVDKKSNLTVTLSSFTHAGVYKYTVTPSCNVPGMTCDTPNTLYVYIDNNDAGNALEVAYIVMFDEEPTTTESGKTATFNASYNKDQNDKSRDLILTKTVEGAYGNQKDPFNFTVKVAPSNNGDKYYYETGSMVNGAFQPDKNQGTEQYIDANGKGIGLAHNKAIKIYGLMKDDTYEIVETKDEKYTTVANVTNDDLAATTEETTTYKVANTTGLAEDTADITVAYTNTHKDTPATGVLLNVAPYALMVIIAAAGCFVFLRKRRDD